MIRWIVGVVLLLWLFSELHMLSALGPILPFLRIVMVIAIVMWVVDWWNGRSVTPL